ncbi:unnamed protein product, partial [Larinioides sclopetarius]
MISVFRIISFFISFFFSFILLFFLFLDLFFPCHKMLNFLALYQSGTQRRQMKNRELNNFKGCKGEERTSILSGVASHIQLDASRGIETEM